MKKLSLKQILKEVQKDEVKDSKQEMFMRMRDYLTLIYDESRKQRVSPEDAETLDPELFQRAMGMEMLKLSDRIPGLPFGQQRGVEVTPIAYDTYGIEQSKRM